MTMTNLAEELTDYSDELTTIAHQKLKAFFQTINHSPSPEMLLGLWHLQDTMTKMLNGEAEKYYYLSSLDPGVGKTTAIRTWLEAYLESDTQHGVLIGLERLEEIQAFITAAGLPEDSYAVLVSDKSDEGEELNGLGLGYDRIDEALVLFTTKAQLRLRTDGKNFEEVSSLFYQGRSRKVRVWDESLTVGKELSLERADLGKLLKTLVRKHKDLADQVEELQKDLKGQPDGTLYRIPELVASSEAIRGMFAEARQEEKEIADTLSRISGRLVSLRNDLYGEVVVDVEEGLPHDFKPCLVTDASGRIRETYNIQDLYREDLIRLEPKGSVKTYTNLTVHLWKRGSGIGVYQDKEVVKSTAHEISEVIRSRPGEDFLIIHHKSNNLDQALLSILNEENKARVYFLTLGKHTATNRFSNIPNVINAGVMFYRDAAYEGLARAASTRRADCGGFEQEKLDRIKKAEAAHHFLQAACRGRVRKAEGSGCPESRLWVIASPQSGLEEMIPDIFPGCTLDPWKLTLESSLKGKSKEAFEYLQELLKEGHTEIKCADIRNHLGMTASNFTRDVLKSDPFNEAVSSLGYFIDPRSRGYYISSTSMS